MCWTIIIYDYVDTMSSFSSLLPPATSDDHFTEQSISRPPSTGVKRRQEQSTTITEDEQGETGVVYMLYFTVILDLHELSCGVYWSSYYESSVKYAVSIESNINCHVN